MKVLMIYPYVPTLRFLKDFAEMIENYQKVILIPLSGTERSKVLKKNTNIWEYLDNWEEGMYEADTILLLNGLYSGEKYEEIIDFGIDKEKEILVEKTVWDILDDGRREKVHLLFDSDTWKEIPPDTALRELDIPIISVMGMGPNTNKFYMQLALKKYFEEKGYQTLVVGSNELSTLFGVPMLPSSMFENISFRQKILILNQYICEKAKEYRPDIIIIGCPGGIMPYDRHVNNGFGEIPLVVSKAIPIDINILLTYYIRKELLDTEYIASIKKYCEENFETSNVFLGMTGVDVQYNEERNQVEYMFLDQKTVQESTGRDLEIFNMMKRETPREICSIIENILKVDFEVV